MLFLLLEKSGISAMWCWKRLFRVQMRIVFEGVRLEEKGFQVEVALKKVDRAFEDYSSFYATLIERGIEETEYGSVFADLASTFKELYIASKTNFDALMLSKSQFEEGRLERDAYERSLIRLEQYVIGAEFEIRLKILPRLKRVEKEILQQQLENKLESIALPEKIEADVKQEISTLQIEIAKAEKVNTIDQVGEYIGIGKKIMQLGNKVWNFAKQSAPAALPLILGIFSSG
jgi:hypothetical protein